MCWIFRWSLCHFRPAMREAQQYDHKWVYEARNPETEELYAKLSPCEVLSGCSLPVNSAHSIWSADNRIEVSNPRHAENVRCMCWRIPARSRGSLYVLSACSWDDRWNFEEDFIFPEQYPWSDHFAEIKRNCKEELDAMDTDINHTGRHRRSAQCHACEGLGKTNESISFMKEDQKIQNTLKRKDGMRNLKEMPLQDCKIVLGYKVSGWKGHKRLASVAQWIAWARRHVDAAVRPAQTCIFISKRDQ